MRKCFFILLAFVAFSASAQDSTLKQYVGTYIFAQGSVVPSAEIYLRGNELIVNSLQGSSTLEKRGRDTFAVISFEGMAYFTRNSNGQVAGVRVVVGEHLLEGVKENVSAYLHRKNYFVAARRYAAR